MWGLRLSLVYWRRPWRAEVITQFSNNLRPIKLSIYQLTHQNKGWGTVIGTETGLRSVNRWIWVWLPAGTKVFLFSRYSRPTLGPTNFLFSGYLGGSLLQESNRGVKQDTHLHLVPNLRMCGTLPSHLHTPWWRAQVQLHFATMA